MLSLLASLRQNILQQAKLKTFPWVKFYMKRKKILMLYEPNNWNSTAQEFVGLLIEGSLIEWCCFRLFHWLPTLLSGLQAQHPHSLHTQTKISLLCWFIPITAAIVNPTSISATALTDLASCDPPTESLQWWMEPTCDARSPACVTLYLPRGMNRHLYQHIWTVGIHLSVSLWPKQCI